MAVANKPKTNANNTSAKAADCLAGSPHPDVPSVEKALMHIVELPIMPKKKGRRQARVYPQRALVDARTIQKTTPAIAIATVLLTIAWPAHPDHW